MQNKKGMKRKTAEVANSDQSGFDRRLFGFRPPADDGADAVAVLIRVGGFFQHFDGFGELLRRLFPIAFGEQPLAVGNRLCDLGHLR